MPMDIRTFFSKSPASKKSSSINKKSKSSSVANSSAAATSRKEASSTEKSKVTESSKGKSTHFDSSGKKDTKKKREPAVLDDSDSEASGEATRNDTKTSNVLAKREDPSSTFVKKKKRIAASDDYDTDDGMAGNTQKPMTTSIRSIAKNAEKKEGDNKKSGQPTKRKNRDDDNDDDGKPIELSPEEFFGKSTNKQKKSSPAKKPKREKEEVAEIDRSKDDEGFMPSSSTSRTSPRKSTDSAIRKRIRDEEEDDDKSDDDDKDYVERPDDSDDDDDDLVIGRPAPKPKQKSPSPQKKKAAAPSPAKGLRNKSPAKRPKKENRVLLEPNTTRHEFDLDSVKVPELFQGLTFVFTGVLDELHRDDAIDFVKSLGGRVTGSVSGKTDYLVVGKQLEDGRHYTEGIKYKTALEKQSVQIIMGTKKLYGLCHDYHEQAKIARGIVDEEPPPKPTTATNVSATTTARSKSSKSPSSNPYTKAATAAPTMSNPYAKKAISNPYAKLASASTNPYAKKASANPYENSNGAGGNDSNSSGGTKSANDTSNQLWVDRHAPKETREILGNREHVNKLAKWLSSWERTFNSPDARKKTCSNPKGPWKAALLSGPPGIGKTTTATLVAKEAGRDLLEFNASDARSKKALQNTLGDITGSRTLHFGGMSSNKSKKKSKQPLRCIIMDEVDGMGAGDRSGMAELIQMIKKSQVPIICICNDRQSQKIKSLVPYCTDLRFRRPTKSVMASRALRIAQEEGFKVERNAAEAIAESCGNDVRQVLNCLQMWAQKTEESSTLTYRNLKEREHSIKKDEILRVSLFDAAKTILEGRRNLSGADPKAEVDSLFRRSDAFFVDYSFTGLIVQQNYPRIMQHQHAQIKRANDQDQELEFLNRMHDAAASMSDYAVVEHEIRNGDLNWSLLPSCGMLAVKTGYHAGGESGGMMPGFPEFTAWMGKNSSKGKKMRLMNEIHHHMNYRVSGNSQDIRECYLPVLRERIMNNMLSGEDGATKDTIALMDEYGLSREDVMEKLDEFRIVATTDKTSKNDRGITMTFADLDSKQKASFTREYNKGSHKSQALVTEELEKAVGGKKKQLKKQKERDPGDIDAIDEDGGDEDSDDDVDEEEELKKLQERFKAKGRKGKGAAPKGKGKANKK